MLVADRKQDCLCELHEAQRYKCGSKYGGHIPRLSVRPRRKLWSWIAECDDVEKYTRRGLSILSPHVLRLPNALSSSVPADS